MLSVSLETLKNGDQSSGSDLLSNELFICQVPNNGTRQEHRFQTGVAIVPRYRSVGFFIRYIANLKTKL